MSNLPALYVLAADYKAAAEQLADLDLPAEVVADTLESLAGDLEVKATNVALFVRNLETAAANIKEAEATMAARRKAIENRAAQITDYLLTNMQRCGISKIDSPYLRLAVQNNPPSVVIDDESALPPSVMVQPEPPPWRPDKARIKDMLKAGEDVPGAHMETKQRLVIK